MPVRISRPVAVTATTPVNTGVAQLPLLVGGTV